MSEAGIKLHVEAGRRGRRAGAESFGPAVKAKAPGWSAGETRAMDGDTMLRRMVGSCVAQILPNATEIARGSRDPEHVHQLRVGLRRLRSIVRGMKPFAARMPAGWEPSIMPVFDALGDARDKHVQSGTIAPRLRKAGVPATDLGGPSEEEAKAIRQLVHGAAFKGTMLRLLAYAEAAEGGPEGDRGKPGSGLGHVTRRLRKLMRQVTKHARGFDELPFARQHEVRKRLKRLRYLAEFAAPAFDRKEVDAWMDRVSPAQDRLGRHIDLSLAAARFASLAESEPGARLAADWLRKKAGAWTRAARKSLERLRRSRSFW